MDLNNFFSAKSIAIVGVSRDPNKVGHVIFRNFIDGGFHGRIFIVNPNADMILNHKSYKNVADIKEKIDLAIIAVPAATVPDVIRDCAKKRIKDVIIISSGFKEGGNFTLDKRLELLLKKYKIRCIGPNCLGCFDAHTKLDSLFLPRYRLSRPKEGGISFVCQSGAVGSAILDLATEQGYGFSRFISYGNAMNIDESDLIEYLGKDEKTKVICLYVEGIKDGRKFMRVASKVSKKKPIIAIKGGVTEEGAKAIISHTGSIAGSAEIYKGAFEQCGVVIADTLSDMFRFAKILEKCMKPKGKRIQVITNGGGYGILSSDAIVKNNLDIAKLSDESKKIIKKLGLTTENPLDLLGDATTARYKAALEMAINDPNVDIILLIVLYQTPLVTTDIVDIIIESNDLKKKPIVVVSTGGEFTELLKKNVESNNVSCYMFPEEAVEAIATLVKYYRSNIKE
mgnify:CR=1 FL=1